MQKANKKLLSWVALLLCGTACGAFWWFDTMAVSSAVPPQTSARPASTPKVPAVNATHAMAPPLISTPPLVSPAVPVAVAGSLQQLTLLRASLEEIKLKAAMNELNAKMKKNEPATSIMIAPPSMLPDLPPPTSPPRLRAGVVSVQGLDGKLSATVRTGSGKVVTARLGDRVAGLGTVTGISKNGVAFKSESGPHSLNFD